MSHTTQFALLVALVAGLGGWTFAQSQLGRDPLAVPGPAPFVVAPGRFTVTAVGNSAVLLDTMSGQSWTFNNERGARWVPFAGGIDFPHAP
ncbi:MAG TPA: hypothetical protein VM165_13810 [Planctomycetaceae bacterium]|nr:hypothetical protein [Planctomycetaceae bacterium]